MMMMIIIITITTQKYWTSKDMSNIPGKYEIRELKNQPYWAVHTTSESTNVKVQIKLGKQHYMELKL